MHNLLFFGELSSLCQHWLKAQATRSSGPYFLHTVLVFGLLLHGLAIMPSGLHASAAEVFEGESLEEADLNAGLFEGQSFTLDSDTLFEVFYEGSIGPVGDTTAVPPAPFDFGGASVNLHAGGSVTGGSAVSHVEMNFFDLADPACPPARWLALRLAARSAETRRAGLRGARHNRHRHAGARAHGTAPLQRPPLRGCVSPGKATRSGLNPKHRSRTAACLENHGTMLGGPCLNDASPRRHVMPLRVTLLLHTPCLEPAAASSRWRASSKTPLDGKTPLRRAPPLPSRRGL